MQGSPSRYLSLLLELVTGMWTGASTPQVFCYNVELNHRTAAKALKIGTQVENKTPWSISSALNKKALKMHNFYELERLFFLQENEVGTNKAGRKHNRSTTAQGICHDLEKSYFSPSITAYSPGQRSRGGNCLVWNKTRYERTSSLIWGKMLSIKFQLCIPKSSWASSFRLLWLRPLRTASIGANYTAASWWFFSLSAHVKDSWL